MKYFFHTLSLNASGINLLTVSSTELNNKIIKQGILLFKANVYKNAAVELTTVL